MNNNMKALIVTVSIITIGMVITVIIAVSVSNNNTDECKDISNTTSEYRACVAVEKCRSEFRPNSQLVGSCIADIITGRR